MFIPFNKPYMTGNELNYIKEAHLGGILAGNGPFSIKCQNWLEEKVCCIKSLLTHSCTAALEMAAILIDTQPGDEIIMPAYTFVSTANAFVLRGGVPVFVDIRTDTLNLDENKIEAAITNKTKAIVPVHYAGVSCEMDKILDLSIEYRLFVIEDAAQGILAEYKDRPLGSIGHLGTYSFHETKNIICGEGGALLINDQSFVDRAEIIRDKGTSRKQFLEGLIDKYTWVDIGSSFLPSELNAAFLLAQMEAASEINKRRLYIWNTYHNAFYELENLGFLKRTYVPNHCKHNAHMYYLLLPTKTHRDKLIQALRDQNIQAIFHYIPLCGTKAGEKYSYTKDFLPITEDVASRIIRLPIWLGIEPYLPMIIDKIASIIKILN